MELVSEILLRVLLCVIFVITEHLSPRWRVIQNEEWWLYKNKSITPYWPSLAVAAVLAIASPCILLSLTRGSRDITAAVLSYTLSILLTGVLTDAIKLLIGRPRPDFYYRCWPHAVDEKFTVDTDSECTGDLDSVIEGRKSFPSGHASLSFAGLSHLSLFLTGRLKLLDSHLPRDKNGWRLIACCLPLILAGFIALSRIADYHHHAEDVIAGACLGCAISYASYRVYYPQLSSPHVAYLSAVDADPINSNATHCNDNNNSLHAYHNNGRRFDV